MNDTSTSSDDEDIRYPPDALFYPNQQCYIPIEICGLQINASQDFITICHENRHFLDFALWKYLKEGNSQLGEVVPPHPPCKKITGTKIEDGSGVIGMLKNIIVVKIPYLDDSRGQPVACREGRDIKLKNVLLVENLPVPIHIATKYHKQICPSVGDYYHVMMRQGKGKRAQVKLAKEHFPERYREHPYWTSSNDEVMPVYEHSNIDQLSLGLKKCMEEGDGRAARHKVAKKYGWKLIRHPSRVLTESWQLPQTGTRIDYFPMTDRILLSNKESGEKRVLDQVGGIVGLEFSFDFQSSLVQ